MMACTHCGKEGHNVRRCPDRLNERLVETQTQVENQEEKIDDLTERMQAVEHNLQAVSWVIRNLEVLLPVVMCLVWVILRAARSLPAEFDAWAVSSQLGSVIGMSVAIAWCAKRAPLIGHVLQNL
jgi:hypothetical protein